MKTRQRADRVSYRVAKQILTDIKYDELGPGDTLPTETQLLETYGVSRGSLREALRILEIHGIIHVKPGKGGGPIVSDTDSADFGRAAALHFNVAGVKFCDLIESRLLLEPQFARRAAELIDDEGEKALRESLDSCWKLQHGPAAQWEHASAGFHIMVGTLAGNKLLAMVNDALATILDERVRSVVPVEDRQAGLEVHKKIADAIIARDGPRAERLMRRHLEALTARIVELQPHVLQETIEWR